MKRIAVLTSGGDAPGMNAAVRSAVRTAIDKGWEAFGIHHGYAGLIRDDLVPLGPRDVGGIIQRGGTMLGSTRCPEFKTDQAQVAAIRFLRQRGIDALIVIGGDGSQAGAFALAQKGFPVVGVASTIDNDLCGSEITIGVDTALNVALEAIDRIKVTAFLSRAGVPRGSDGAGFWLSRADFRDSWRGRMHCPSRGRDRSRNGSL